VRKRDLIRRLDLDMDRGDNDGSSDDDGMGGDPHLLLLQLQALPTATINGIMRIMSKRLWAKNIGDQVMTRHPVNPGDDKEKYL
jgi:hypothetical protein